MTKHALDDFKKLSEDELLMKSVPYVQDDVWTVSNSVITTRFDYKGYDFTGAVFQANPGTHVFMRSIPILAVYKGIPPDISEVIPLILIQMNGPNIKSKIAWPTIAEAEGAVRANLMRVMLLGGVTV